MNRAQAVKALQSLKNRLLPESGERADAETLLSHPEIREAISFALKRLSVSEEAAETKSGFRWSDEEDQLLIESFDAGKAPEAIASELKRSLSSVSNRLKRLGKLEEYS